MKDRLPNNGSPSTEELWKGVERFQEVKRLATATGVGVIFQEGGEIFIVYDPKKAGSRVEPFESS